MSDFLNFRVIPALALKISKSIDAPERSFLTTQMWEDDIKAVATIVGTYFKHNRRYNCSGCPALDIILTKNYCITISIQRIISIHKFILKIKQFIGSHELKGHGHFWPHPPKKTELTFNFPEFVPAWKKSVYTVCSSLRYSQF